MAPLRQRLAGHRLIGLDASVFIYHLEASPRYVAHTRALLNGVERGRWRGVTSVVTLLELTVRPWQRERADIARQYEALLANFPGLLLADVTRDVARHAARLRGQHRLRSADALHVATALVHGATAFVTNDRALSRLSSELEIVNLDDLAPR